MAKKRAIKKTKKVTTKVKGQENITKTNQLEVIQGNVPMVTVKLLSAINTHLAEIVRLLREKK